MANDSGIQLVWGWDNRFASLFPILAAASNVIVGDNPPYSASDFFSFYPKFGGAPITVTGVIDGTTSTVTGVSSVAGLLAGQYVTGRGIQGGTTLVSAAGSTIQLSLPTTLAGNPVQLTVYVAPLIPAAVLNAYIYLAANSLFQQRWGEAWLQVMALFIAHYCTLWLQGEASSPNTTAGQAAASGLALGIKTSKAAGDVSVSSQPIIFEKFGAWNLTLYGQELITLATVIGSGNMLLL